MKKVLFFLLLFAAQYSRAQVPPDSSQQVEDITADTSAEDSTAIVTEIGDTSKATFFKPLWGHDPHSPAKAALFSAVIPGLGQLYNGKWWKVPIVYAGLGTAGGFIIYNTNYYHSLKEAVILRFDGDSTTVDEYVSFASDDQLLSEADIVKRYVDLSWITASAIYLLNIIDALVDGHLYNFDVGDDLSLHVDPFVQFSTNSKNVFVNALQPASNRATFGLKINLSIK